MDEKFVLRVILTLLFLLVSSVGLLFRFFLKCRGLEKRLKKADENLRLLRREVVTAVGEVLKRLRYQTVVHTRQSHKDVFLIEDNMTHFKSHIILSWEDGDEKSPVLLGVSHSRYEQHLLIQGTTIREAIEMAVATIKDDRCFKTSTR